MPVFLTDFTNQVWATESPVDGYLQVGFIGRAGYRVEDLLAFAASRDKQFKSFLEKKSERIESGTARQRDVRPAEVRRAAVPGNAQGGSGE